MSGDYNDSSKMIMQYYPRTPDLVLLDTNGDKNNNKASSVQALLQSGRPVIVEEKVGGRNRLLGIRTTRTQHNPHPQFVVEFQDGPNTSRLLSDSGSNNDGSRIQLWLDEHRSELLDLLGTEGRLILFGAWCGGGGGSSADCKNVAYCYDRLPGYFVACDLLDVQENKFYSRPRFHLALQGSGIPVVPTIGILATTFGRSAENDATRSDQKCGTRAKKDSQTNKHERLRNNKEAFMSSVQNVLDSTASAFRHQGHAVEGIVLRQDSRDWMIRQFQVVLPNITIDADNTENDGGDNNMVDYGFALSYMEQCYVFARETTATTTGTAEEATAAALSPAGGSGATSRSGKKTRPKATRSKKNKAAQADKNSSSLEAMMKARRRRIPRCIVLAGLPASGKSTFAQRLKNALDQDDRSNISNKNQSSASTASSSTTATTTTLVANQDTLGRRECEKVASRASHRNRVIVDRCNPTEADRREWVACMHSPSPADVALIYFATSEEQCAQRVGWRLNHPSMPSSSSLSSSGGSSSSSALNHNYTTTANGGGSDGKRRIVQQVAARMEPPTEHERRRVFGRVETVRTWQEADALLYQMGVTDDDDGGDGSCH